MNFLSIVLFCSCTFIISSLAGEIIPKLKDYAEKTRISKNHPESKVTITVGEKNGFFYTVNGITQSLGRISVSGDYVNDELHGTGYAWLFLSANSHVALYDFRYVRNHMEVLIENFLFEKFYFEVIPPHVVNVHALRISQINETTVLVSGPSRSAPFKRNDDILAPKEINSIDQPAL